jgi:hypothetical protein
MRRRNRFGQFALLLISLAIFIKASGKATADPNTIVKSTDEVARQFKPDVFSYQLQYRPQIDLNGTWSLRRDPDDAGKKAVWYRGEEKFPESMKVSGAPQAQGIGEPHKYQRTMFMEPFWIRREFHVRLLQPTERVWLRLGGVLPAAEVYVNGQYVGYTKSSRTGQRVDITGLATPGAKNLIAIKVCDFPEVRMDGLLEWNEGT